MTTPRDAAEPPAGAGRSGLGLPAEPAGTPRRVLARFRGLGRFLLAEAPLRAEQLSADVPELRRIIEQGHGVIRNTELSGSVMYISVRDGLRTTSASPPEWADPAEVVDVSESVMAGQPLLGRLRRVGDQLRALDPGRYEMYRCAETVRAVEQRHGDPLAADTGDCVEAFAAVPALNAFAVDPPSGPAGFRDLAAHVLAGYDELRLSGWAVHRAVALAGLMEVAGDLGPAAQRAASAEVRRWRQAAGGDSWPPETGRGRRGPPLAGALWADAFDQVTDGRAWIPALSAGRLAQEQADAYRDAARRELTFEQFHRVLYLGLGYYLAAALLFGVVTGAGPGRVREPLLSEAADRARSCEEMRARIETSIGWAVEVNPMGYDLTDPARLQSWALSLPRDRAALRIYDVSSQLGYPDVARDIALAVADFAAGREEQCAQRAAAVARAMAAPDTLPPTVEWGLGYFSCAAALAQRVYERLGETAQAADLARYNDRDWLAAQLARPPA